ncbi:MAG: LysE/ArgO family amino acid transporter [Gammaproteobacteria bacterium]|nr:LysE/ArgO family amino acid transporter [Gammaproteobacteria bacterium]MDH3536298.1 LysE/ArgO family amino acid transporter [Gammaproteobacteria bacterium]
MHAYLFGFSLGFSLILAIGAQNAFVLKQGLKDEHVLLVCLICALSDALLILVGVSGFHALVAAFPALVDIARFGGAAFLFAYGLLSFYNALRVQQGLRPSEISSNSAWQSALTCLAFTWLNPHVYLDTVVLLGSVSTQFGDRLAWFAGGAVSASFLFFFMLGFGARLLRPLFADVRAWRVLDFAIGCVMWSIATHLALMD